MEKELQEHLRNNLSIIVKDTKLTLADLPDTKFKELLKSNAYRFRVLSGSLRSGLMYATECFSGEVDRLLVEIVTDEIVKKDRTYSLFFENIFEYLLGSGLKYTIAFPDKSLVCKTIEEEEQYLSVMKEMFSKYIENSKLDAFMFYIDYEERIFANRFPPKFFVGDEAMLEELSKTK